MTNEKQDCKCHVRMLDCVADAKDRGDTLKAAYLAGEVLAIEEMQNKPISGIEVATTISIDREGRLSVEGSMLCTKCGFEFYFRNVEWLTRG